MKQESASGQPDERVATSDAHVRDSVRLSRNDHNARVRFMANYEDITGVDGNALADSHPGTAAALGLAARAWQHAAERLAGSLLPGPDGRIDFDQERCLFSAGAYGVLVAPGYRYQGEPREWEQDDDYEGEHFLTEGDPFWLLELVAATVEASERGDENVLGTTCRHYQGIADLDQARSTARRELLSPLRSPGREDLDLTRFPVDAWLDPVGRLRRATLHIGPQKTSLELADYGQAEGIDLPDASEIVRE
jgi:hypothetical protein